MPRILPGTQVLLQRMQVLPWALCHICQPYVNIIHTLKCVQWHEITVFRSLDQVLVALPGAQKPKNQEGEQMKRTRDDR